MKFAQYTSTALLISILFLATSCTEKVTVDTSIPEVSYCTTNATFSPSYTITGTARYKRRPASSAGLGAIEVGDHAIRRAEVQILNASGQIVQCTETSATGTFSFTVPRDSATYTVKVNSRSYNAFNKASVLTDPQSNELHSISTTFVADATKAIGSIIAPATNSDLRGGAFNILDRFYDSNDFLLSNTGGAFAVAHKVQAYWSRGVNPVTYFGGDPTEGVSFYVPGTDKLYILGGIEGDVTVEDTDHFDDSVIVHEFGHFVEDNYSKSDSPGGTHYGSYAVDARLAWSEAFSTFLATQVLGSPIYVDTIGIGSAVGFYYDAQNDEDISGNPKDVVTAGAVGEGGFRELAVLRFLWHAIDSIPAFDFEEFWSVYTNGFVNNEPFREMSLFLQRQALDGSTNISSLLADDDKEMDATRRHYGTRDLASSNLPGNAACQWSITASAKLPTLAGSTVYERSNPYYSNDFYYIYHPGGTLNLLLDYSLLATTADLDLYVYKDGYQFGVSNDIQVYSNQARCPVSSGACENRSETISANVPAGNYMVNVMYYNDGAGSQPATYTLRLGGNDYICR